MGLLGTRSVPGPFGQSHPSLYPPCWADSGAEVQRGEATSPCHTASMKRTWARNTGFWFSPGFGTQGPSSLFPALSAAGSTGVQWVLSHGGSLTPGEDCLLLIWACQRHGRPALALWEVPVSLLCQL